jgi:hypothetical protein
VTVPIPGNYTCNDPDPKGWWVKGNYEFAGGVQDTTSSNAYLLGDPVRPGQMARLPYAHAVQLNRGARVRTMRRERALGRRLASTVTPCVRRW